MARLSNLFSLSKCIEIVQAYAPYYLQGIVYTVPCNHSRLCIRPAADAYAPQQDRTAAVYQHCLC